MGTKLVIVAIPAHTPAIVPIKATSSDGVKVITLSISPPKKKRAITRPRSYKSLYINSGKSSNACANKAIAPLSVGCIPSPLNIPVIQFVLLSAPTA